MKGQRQVKRDKLIIIILSCLVVIEAAIIFRMLAERRPKKPVAVTVLPKGKIAIVIDDWGYNKNNLPIVSQIKYPLTVSILPNLAYSTEVSSKLHEMNFEVILHLPMEPREKFRMEKNTLLVSMNGQQIKDIINEDLDSLIYSRGVSNHMGSQFTRNRRSMEIVFKELKQKQLYFLDSVVASDSVCSKLAKEAGIKFARRDIFLDNKEDTPYIKAQINKLKNKARSRGQAIGIGHDRKNTLKVLGEVMPELAKEGYSFVFVSDLVK